MDPATPLDPALAAPVPFTPPIVRQTTDELTATSANLLAQSRQLNARLDRLAMPAGYRLTAAGEIESREESFGGIGSAVIVAVFAIMAILVLEFRSFRTTMVVYLDRPPAALLARMKSKWRYNINLAHRKGVSVIHDNSTAARRLLIPWPCESTRCWPGWRSEQFL